MVHEILPGILEKEVSRIHEKITQVTPFAKSLHIDLIDGKFANNTTILDPKVYTPYAKDFFLEVHMMVIDPMQYLDAFAKAGFRRFIGHVENMPDQVAFVAKGQQLGEVGLGIDGPTSLEAITVPLQDLDTVLVYTSEKVGFSGPPFLPNRLEKIKVIRKQTDIPLIVDGGITDETLPLAYDAGVTRFVSTSFLFGHGDVKTQYQKLNMSLQTKIDSAFASRSDQ